MLLLTSVAAAAAATADLTCYLVCVKESEADDFDQPGWMRLEPPHEGCVLFVHRERELLVVRTRGIL